MKINTFFIKKEITSQNWMKFVFPDKFEKKVKIP